MKDVPPAGSPASTAQQGRLLRPRQSFQIAGVHLVHCSARMMPLAVPLAASAVAAEIPLQQLLQQTMIFPKRHPHLSIYRAAGHPLVMLRAASHQPV